MSLAEVADEIEQSSTGIAALVRKGELAPAVESLQHLLGRIVLLWRHWAGADVARIG